MQVWALACLLGASIFARPVFARPDPKIIPLVIIGAGIAGETMALAAQQLGIEFQIFEASNRTGGRIQTATSPGRRWNQGATLVNRSDFRLRSLIEDLGLHLIPRRGPDEARHEHYIFGDHAYTEVEFMQLLRMRFGGQLRRFSEDAEKWSSGDAKTKRELSGLSAQQYLEKIGATDFPLYNYFRVVESELKSSLRTLGFEVLFENFQYDGQQLSFLYSSDEYFAVAETMGEVIHRMDERLTAPIQLNHTLLSVRRRADSQGNAYYSLKFKTPQGSRTVHTRIPFITIPPNELAKIKFQTPEVTPAMRERFAQTTYANTVKHFTIFRKKIWSHGTVLGETELGEPFQVWDSSSELVRAPAEWGALTIFSSLIHETPEEEMAFINRVLDKLEIAHPGLRALRETHETIVWPHSYSTAYAPGEWELGPLIANPGGGRIVLAGEAFAKKDSGTEKKEAGPGYLEGALQTVEVGIRKVFEFFRPAVCNRVLIGGWQVQAEARVYQR